MTRDLNEGPNKMLERPVELRIVGIGGSLRQRSYSYLALEYAMSLLTRMGCCTHIVDLRQTRLPFCNGDKRELAAHAEVTQLRAAVSKAHAIVLSTPEYHGSLSGVLKNALDLLDREHLEGKVTGAISVLGGPPSSNALNDLSKIMRSCHAWVIPQHIAIGHASAVFIDGQIRDVDLQHRFEQFAASLARTASRMHDLEQLAEPDSAIFMNELRVPASHSARTSQR
jgi:NAD(P)H-dependent FMN reductase